MISEEIIDLIFDGIFNNPYCDSDYRKMNTIGVLRLFFDTYDFYNFVNTHHITKDEYKIYFKPYVKQIQPSTHKIIKRYYKSKGELI